MTSHLTERVERVKPSATIAVSARAAELKAAGHDVIGLGAGEPDFDTPQHIKDAAIEAIRSGQTKYPPVDGTPAPKAAGIGKFERDNGLRYAPQQILASSGAKHSIINAMLALIEAGDEVIIPAPYWVSYPDMTRLVDGTPVIVDCAADSQFKLTAEGLAKVLTPHSRLLILNSPNNPTGQVHTRTELEAIGEVLRAWPRVMVLSDDIYERVAHQVDVERLNRHQPGDVHEVLGAKKQQLEHGDALGLADLQRVGGDLDGLGAVVLEAAKGRAGAVQRPLRGGGPAPQQRDGERGVSRSHRSQPPSPPGRSSLAPGPRTGCSRFRPCA